MGTFIFWDRGSIELKNCFNSKSKRVLYKYSMQVSSASFTMMLFALYQFYMLCNSFFFFWGGAELFVNGSRLSVSSVPRPFSLCFMGYVDVLLGFLPRALN